MYPFKTTAERERSISPTVLVAGASESTTTTQQVEKENTTNNRSRNSTTNFTSSSKKRSSTMKSSGEESDDTESVFSEDTETSTDNQQTKNKKKKELSSIPSRRWSGPALKKRELEWGSRFQELLRYKEEHGTTNVAWNDGKLGTWVVKQRAQYKLWTENKHSQMTESRIRLLNSIDFQWSLYNKWDDKFDELLKYKEQHGHANVPKNYGPLGVWVGDQRTQYKLLKKNRYSRMTIERFKLLESIGFEWSIFKGWEDKFRELIDYKVANGHTNIPVRDGPLGVWVGNQRTQYRMYRENKRSSMNPRRIELLESVGFEWSLRK